MMEKVNKKLALFLIAAIALGAFSNAAVSKGRQNSKPIKEWYLSNSVSVKDDASGKIYPGGHAILGRLAESKDSYDKHDIPVFSSAAGARAAAVFIHEDWEDRSGEYLSDYHDTRGRRDSWDFTVVSNVALGEVTLSWNSVALISSEINGETDYEEQGVPDLKTLRKLHLIDLETLQTIDAVSSHGEPNHYTFRMFGGETTRKFRWVFGPITSKAYAESSEIRKRNGIKKGAKKTAKRN